MTLEAILALLTVAATGLLLVGFERALRPDLSHLERRIRRYAGRGYRLSEEEQKQAATVQVTQFLAQRVEASISGHSFATALQSSLARANVKLTVAEFLILQGSAAATVAALALLISGSPLVAAVFAFGGWLLPRLWLARRQAARLKAFNDQLPDTIALMSNSLRSGLSLVQSMEMISREAPPPVSEEFQRVVREIGLGIGPQDALQHLVRRVASEDLDLIVTAVLVQFEIGGNLARILDSIASTIRERIKLKGEIRTLSAQGRAAGYMLSSLPAAVAGILLLIAPSYIGKLLSPGPWLALPVIAVGGILAGGLTIRKMVDIEL